MAKKEGDKPKKQDLGSQLEGGGQEGFSQEDVKRLSRLIAEVWADDKLKQRLIDKPAAVLKEYGIAMPSGVEVRVVEDTPQVHHLVLPPKPAGGVRELTSSQLDGVAGGFCACRLCACKTPKPDICTPERVCEISTGPLTRTKG